MLNKIFFAKLSALLVVMAGIGLAVLAVTPTGASATNFNSCSPGLKIDSECVYNGRACAYDKLAKKYLWKGTHEDCSCLWEVQDIDKKVFFNFGDVKPGDTGEDTISLHPSGDQWLCAAFEGVNNFENGCTEPESAEDSTCANPGAGKGELQNYLLLTAWRDSDCDNILDPGETIIINNKPFQNTILAFSDSKSGFGPLKSGKTYCLGISWKLPIETGNIVQTDSVVGNIKFTAVQSQNNLNFVCGSGNACVPKIETCDGIDNDCDGQIDEGRNWENKGNFCAVGNGRCQKIGVYVCDPKDPSGKTICSVKEDKSCGSVGKKDDIFGCGNNFINKLKYDRL